MFIVAVDTIIDIKINSSFMIFKSKLISRKLHVLALLCNRYDFCVINKL